MILAENSATMDERYFGINLAIFSFLIEILDSINTKYCNNRRFLLKCTCDATSVQSDEEDPNTTSYIPFTTLIPQNSIQRHGEQALRNFVSYLHL